MNYHDSYGDKLDAVILKVINLEGLDLSHYANLMIIAETGYKAMFRNHIPEFISEYVNVAEPLSARIINFPRSLQTFLKIGVVVTFNGTSKVLTLARDEHIHLPNDTDIENLTCDCEEASTIAGVINQIEDGLIPLSQYARYYGAFRGGQYVGEMFGYEGGRSSAGGFRIDYNNRRVVISSDAPTDRDYLICFKPNPFYKGPDTIIPEYAVEALMAYIRYNRLNQRNSTPGYRYEMENKWITEQKNMKNFIHLNGVTADDIMGMFYGNGLSPK
ncbi:MAG TPA: hypothetical protein DCG24_09065 [Bacteroidetes bacterium]|nr:hypothetical protein [Myxococcales bacterium]MCB0796780.1 hypothetical protein [Chitinophagales bacterium]HAE14371.1 hypothetical protein [Bacteroidota bacterium]HQU38956.1 hypothetical protein [Chitinophagales bacterium]HQU77273.1 hypothetical protein [Chitinophagales bacterium]